eukprot:CAMPEP_0179188952 /NCGR_PEP_ID=MMETSP0796-20121207/93791_1 /TAXON_ID=73915 /ORGANISM="Pyrodinium bahamense, Strain pbaha01" /LENGTH=309 /DNA_ID=CAMNT_0020893071 /DNA_START=171 /DNA_END=1098 /DNA_ORIENTATION=-
MASRDPEAAGGDGARAELGRPAGGSAARRGGAHLEASRLQANRVRLRTKSLGLPLLSEEVEHSGEEGEESACEEEHCAAAWSCPLCTFLNCGLLPVCEICQTHRDAEHTKAPLYGRGPGVTSPRGPAPAAAAGGESGQKEDWPSLHEAADAWELCVDRVRLRTKSLGLPLLSEEAAHSGDEREERACEEELCPAAWSCPLCTFLNCGLLPACEMCQTLRDAERTRAPLDGPGPGVTPPRRPVPAAAAGGESGHEEDWPSLHEAADAWELCEVSSVGSSWLDVDAADMRAEDDGEADAVLVRATGSAGVV